MVVTKPKLIMYEGGIDLTKDDIYYLGVEDPELLGYFEEVAYNLVKGNPELLGAVGTAVAAVAKGVFGIGKRIFRRIKARRRAKGKGNIFRRIRDRIRARRKKRKARRRGTPAIVKPAPVATVMNQQQQVQSQYNQQQLHNLRNAMESKKRQGQNVKTMAMMALPVLSLGLLLGIDPEYY